MRMIGHIPNKSNAVTFSDFLYVQGITNQVEQEKEGWAVWIHSEDELDKAKNMLIHFLANPADPQYRSQARQATEVKEREEEEQEEAAQRYFDRERTFRTGLVFGLGPITFVLVLVSVVVTVLRSFAPDQSWLGNLWFSEYKAGAPEILHGQIWRLITPIFVHADFRQGAGIMHLVFNVLCIFSLGGVLESRRGSGWFLSFVLLVAALSNTGEYLVSDHLFGGLSGVVYGFLGYIWIKGKFDPNSDLALPQQTVVMMLAWYFLCLVHISPNVANMVHTVGLLTGMAWGYLSSIKSR